MPVWTHLFLLIPALPLVWEDFRLREVSVVWLFVLACASLTVGWSNLGFASVLWRMAVNILLLCLLVAVSALWLLVRRHGLKNFFCLPLGVKGFFIRWLGAGDIVFMAAVTPLLGPVEYVRFLLVACCAALVWWLTTRAKTIPLAGVMALTLAGYVVCKTCGLWN